MSEQVLPVLKSLLSQPQLPETAEPMLLVSSGRKEKNGEVAVALSDREFSISASFGPSAQDLAHQLDRGKTIRITDYKFTYNEDSATRPVELIIDDFEFVGITTTALRDAIIKIKRDTFDEFRQNATSHKLNSSKGSGLQGATGVIGIEGLSPFTDSKWRIRARASQKGDIRFFERKRRVDDVGQGKLFNVVFTDETGEIRATGFGDSVDKFYETIRDGKVYYISGCDVRQANAKFNNTNNDFELIFRDHDTRIEPCNDDIEVPLVSFHFVEDIEHLMNIENDGTCDIVGVISSVGPVDQLTAKTTNRPYSRREINLADPTGYSVRCTLWGDQAESFEHDVGTVLALKGVRVTDFDGKSLSLMRSSVIFPDPVDVSKAHSIKGWWDDEGKKQQLHSLREKTQTILEGGDGNTGAKGQELPKSIQEVYDERLGQSDTPDYFTVKARISHIYQRTMTYPACPKEDCLKRVTDNGDGWRCEKCEKSYPAPHYRYVLTLTIGDDTAGEQGLMVSVFDEIGTQIFGRPGDEIEALKEEASPQLNEIINSVIGDEYSWRVRAKQETYNDEVRVRYQALSAVSTKKDIFKLTEGLLTEMGF